VAACPCHESKSRSSLAIRELEDGRVLLHDFGGCPTEEILATVGLELDVLFPERVDDQTRRPRERHPFSPGDALRCLSYEATLVALAAGDLARGAVLAPEDVERLQEAAGRINTARTLCDA
jgi:hypothetical protein